MMKKCLCSLHLLLLGALVAYLGLDGRRTHDRQLCELDPLVGRPHANAEPDYASSLGARSAKEERDLRIIVGSLAGGPARVRLSPLYAICIRSVPLAFVISILM
jgi:hypothetical protein